LTALPAAFFVIAFFTWRLFPSDNCSRDDWRRSFVFAAVTWGVLLSLITEALSLDRALSVLGLTLAWTFACVACATLGMIRLFVLGASCAGHWPGRRFHWGTVALLIACCLIVALVGLIAEAAPPNTWDSMTYHLARVAQWSQHGTIANYPANTVRQLYQPPFAEWAILHLQILSGGSARSYSPRLWYLLSIASAFAVFCLYLRWQHWNSRLIMPLFLMMAPLSGVALAEISMKKIVAAIALFLICSSTLWVGLNLNRPLIGPRSVLIYPRVAQYFIERPELQHAYIRAVTQIRSIRCTRIGLVGAEDDWEYPMWVLLGSASGPGPTVEDVTPDNASKALLQSSPYQAFRPCALVTLHPEKSTLLRFAGSVFVRTPSSSLAPVFRIEKSLMPTRVR
jgi:hypothetical protein